MSDDRVSENRVTENTVTETQPNPNLSTEDPNADALLDKTRESTETIPRKSSLTGADGEGRP
jgi:hypothetical protein